MSTNPGDQAPPSYDFPGGMPEFGASGGSGRGGAGGPGRPGTPAPRPRRNGGLIAGVAVAVAAVVGGLVYTGGDGPTGGSTTPALGDVAWQVPSRSALEPLEEPLDGLGRWWDEPVTVVGDHALWRVGPPDANEMGAQEVTLESYDLDDGALEWSRDLVDVRCEAVPRTGAGADPRQLACVSRAVDGTGNGDAGLVEILDLRTGRTDLQWEVPATAIAVHASATGLVVLDHPDAGSGLRWYDLDGTLRWEADVRTDGLGEELLFERDGTTSPSPYADFVDVGDQVVVTSSSSTLVLDENGWTTREDCRFAGVVGDAVACTTWEGTRLERAGEVLWSQPDLRLREVPIRPRPDVLVSENWETGAVGWVDPATGEVGPALLTGADRVDVVGTPTVPLLQTDGDSGENGVPRTLVALDPVTGQERWTTTIQAYWSAETVVTDSHVLVQRTWPEWTVLSAETGKEVAVVSISGTLTTSGDVLLASLGGRMSRIALG
ncbi:hypothetical protein C8046_09815 [Serinibacter arcticus]|uniref:Pyrrolo-quinoline quinone n=1 Tax=Serinibacter arcticus TaxID=1655435 RepID=A0A2U1ZV88_9MICO|nr:hypothetical protein [Serinibacter arcticus]PWD50905.1 hypothetical protein C8046_09815 [Serinibacter arcticus]